MRPCRLHITGASGTGTTSLGRAVADHWAVPHADIDDYFWVPSCPPFVTERPAPERVGLMQELFLPRSGWVLSGSLMGWGDSLRTIFDAVVFLSLDRGDRLARLRERELARYGDLVMPGGELERAHRDFLDWAARYDEPDFDGRSRARHERWLFDLSCPVLKLDASGSRAELLSSTLTWVAELDVTTHRAQPDPS
jgi:adenylate kinase family enzyme